MISYDRMYVFLLGVEYQRLLLAEAEANGGGLQMSDLDLTKLENWREGLRRAGTNGGTNAGILLYNIFVIIVCI